MAAPHAAVKSVAKATNQMRRNARVRAHQWSRKPPPLRVVISPTSYLIETLGAALTRYERIASNDRRNGNALAAQR